MPDYTKAVTGVERFLCITSRSEVQDILTHKNFEPERIADIVKNV